MLSKLLKKKDSFVLIAICGAVILFGGLAHLLAWAGLGWGIWSLIRED